ncbi:MAG: hypothetical protein KAI97_05085, partial [Gemmatimonadetes bacterium]|nr:hypothetical protein [Gemmatimonadota bacterium]
MRIPFSQLRFNEGGTFAFGVNINRYIPSKNEDVYWIEVPRDEAGWPSWFGDLEGIQGIRTRRPVELVPYVTGTATTTSSSLIDPADPFSSRSESDGRAGADLKMGIGPSLTLDATFNPDFGQVEADPAVVNLSAFEIFFPERRPFFTEGSQLLAGGGHNYFYSRRIGANPSGNPDGDYVDVPKNTSILGAAKLTGRMGSGLNVGFLGAVTAKEKARVHDSATGITGEQTVEPMAGWGIARLQQEVFGNGSWIGAVATGVERDLDPGDGLDTFLRKRAYSGGADWRIRFAGGKYVLNGNAGGSHIEGTTDAIESAQRSSARFFQRPDANYVRLDPTRTSLTGWTASTNFEKNEGSWLWNVRASAESPEFEINDVGRLGTADDIDTSAGLRYRQNNPGSFYQDYWVGAWVGSGWNFGRDRQYSFLDVESGLTFKNFYGMWMSAEYFPSAQSDNLTRGGPSMGTAESWDFDLNFWSNSQGRTSWWSFASYEGDELGGERYVAEAGITVRPGSRWQFSLTPRYSYTVNPRQYVSTYDGTGRPATFDNRYVFAFIDRTEIASTMRLNYSFTPNFTLEAYVEPFASSGSYSRHGELLATRSKNLLTYGTAGTTIEREDDGSYTVTDGQDT